MAIDKDRMTVGVLAADDLDPSSERPDNIEQHSIIDVFRLVPDFLLQCYADTKGT